MPTPLVWIHFTKSLHLASGISKVPLFHFPLEGFMLFQMETPSFPDKDEEFFWE